MVNRLCRESKGTEESKARAQVARNERRLFVRMVIVERVVGGREETVAGVQDTFPGHLSIAEAAGNATVERLVAGKKLQEPEVIRELSSAEPADLSGSLLPGKREDYSNSHPSGVFYKTALIARIKYAPLSVA